jgi:hypothetical protein
MRYVLLMAVLATAGCAKPDPLEQSRAAYSGCLSAKPVEQCQNERARLDADLEVSNAQARRTAAVPPLVLSGSRTPVTRQPVTCTTTGDTTRCF